jgi:hypothetical protein
MGQSQKRILVLVDLHGPVDLVLRAVLACRTVSDHGVFPEQVRSCFTKLGSRDYRMRQLRTTDVANSLTDDFGFGLTNGKRALQSFFFHANDLFTYC